MLKNTHVKLTNNLLNSGTNRSLFRVVETDLELGANDSALVAFEILKGRSDGPLPPHTHILPNA